MSAEKHSRAEARYALGEPMTAWSRATDGAEPGDVIAGKYSLVRPIGRGGMGTVFEARHTTLGRPIAIKVLRPEVAEERDVIERFLREARSAAALAHPRIVDVFDVGWTDDGLVPWFAMELLEGRNLASELAATGGIPAARAISIISQVLDALEVAHAQGIVHRDLKPENVFLVPHGLDDDVKVLDFGISKVMAKRITVTGVILGTPAYMSPEQARGAREIDYRADLYAAGAMLFEMLAGSPPFSGASFHQILLAIMTGERPRLSTLRPTLHPGLCEIVERALAAEPSDRWQSAAEMRDALVAVADMIDQFAGRSSEPSDGSITATRAWSPTPRAAAADASTDDEVQTRAERPAASTPRPEPGPPAERSPTPLPLLHGVGPGRPAEAPPPPRSSIVVPLVVLGWVLLGAAAAATILLLVR